MIIRKARLEDSLQIAEVHIKSWQQAYKGIISEEYLNNLSVKDRQQMWESSLSSPRDDAPVYVAVNEEGSIVGFASFGIERERRRPMEGELYAIYLLNENRRSGNGTMLLKAGIQDLIKHNFKSVLVWVLAENPSREFYEKFSPAKVDTKTIQIGNDSLEEIAYKWEEINGLFEKLE